MRSGVNTQWQLWVSEGCKYKDGNMEGMCGDCNGDAQNDWVTCTDPSTILDINDAALTAISDSCVEGVRQGDEPNGGRKLG